MPIAYYNEFDPNAAAWLRELIKQGLIADGIVDERSIIDVHANDLVGFTQCHFFAGIGGWSRALRLANWQDDKAVWTASLPCQPFSTAGKQQGKADERHLLPHFLELVKQCRPDTIFGEQVEAAIRHGWLDDLQAAMEAENYAVGHVILGAHSVQSFHQRQRLYWVAHTSSERYARSEREESTGKERFPSRSSGDCSTINVAGDTEHNGQSTVPKPTSHVQPSPKWRTDGANLSGEPEGTSQSSNAASLSRRANGCSEWDNPDWLYCRDGKYRAIKPSIKPLVNGLPKGMVYSSDISAPTNPNETQEARVMRLKGYGNAIVAQVAAEFISAFTEILN